jgi:SOS response regulatory protein OraA/RecX
LRQRDRTTAQLDRQLTARGFDEAERRAALATLSRGGVLDDARYAANRARVLSERGSGDALIRHDLTSAGLAPEDVELALSDLDAERERALRIVARRGASSRTARYLVARGFSDDVVCDAVAPTADDALG